MLDNGTSLNSFRLCEISSNAHMDESGILILEGMMEQEINTLEKVRVNYYNKLIDFHVVDNNFTIREAY